MNKQTKKNIEPGKRKYSSPILKKYGSVGQLTTGGTAGVKEEGNPTSKQGQTGKVKN